MRKCPNCGNVYDPDDPELDLKLAARQQMPIILIKFEQQELDLSLLRFHCVACSAEWTGFYRKDTLLSVERWHMRTK